MHRDPSYPREIPARAFLRLAEGYDFDIMVEAKQKDAAALRLARDLGLELRPLRPLAGATPRDTAGCGARGWRPQEDGTEPPVPVRAPDRTGLSGTRGGTG
nr:MAG: hypothetical protein DIU70_08480 [Bacillota bacterium]